MRSAHIDAIVRAQIDPDGPGVAVAVVKDVSVLHCQGYGLANIEWKQAIAPDTVFRLASLTKPLTATAVMLLEKQGKLSIDAPVSTYLSGYPTRGEPITLAHLLTHTSGIKNYLAPTGPFERLYKTDKTPDELIALFEELPLDFEPGTQYCYSNSGYCLLGKIIEVASGMSYEAFIQTHIFRPLSMKHSYYMNNEPIIPSRASGYVKTVHGYEHAPSLSMTWPYAAGSLGSSLADLIRWDSALRGEQLLDRKTQERMYTPFTLTNGRRGSYGFGWRVTHYRGHRVICHGGSFHGCSTFLGRFLEDDMTIIILSNLSGFGAKALAQQISASVLDLPKPKLRPFPLDTERLLKVAGTYEGVEGTVEIRCDGQWLTMSGPMTCRLVPLSETQFYSEENEDVEVHFEDGAISGFQRATIIEPFSYSTLNRVEQKKNMSQN